MTDSNEEILRRSLDAVDRHRQRLMLALVATALLLLVTFIVGAHSPSTRDAVLAHYFMLLIWVTGLTLVVVIQITVMTKRILRAIELASRK
jgi:glycerol uptake facilitator-like aquaporin